MGPPDRTKAELAALPPFPYIPPGGYFTGDWFRKFHEWQWERFKETPEDMMARIMGTASGGAAAASLKPTLSAGVSASDEVADAAFRGGKMAYTENWSVYKEKD